MNENLSEIRDPIRGSLLIKKDDTLISEAGSCYPIINNIPRFVGSENYSADLGLQWNVFRLTQLDSYNGIDITESRSKRCLRDNLTILNGKRVLEVGSGADRFTEVLLEYGAIVHSFDFSSAVDANAKNNGSSEKLTLV